ncbi:MAG: UPF0280 family protein [Kiritimatiellae bacterium]|nr:UPF0280 family protein [Kiritimatiellia bacterium]
MRTWREFVYKDASFSICCSRFEAVAAELVRQRSVLEQYIEQHPEFQRALCPICVASDAPEVVRRMSASAASVGVGPMAAVAGVMAQLACEAGIAAGAHEAIVDNGGDIFIVARHTVIIRLFSGRAAIGNRLAFLVNPSETPVAVCSSSGTMGHSLSFGRCDLATIVARDGGLADAAATEAANQVQTAADLERVLKQVLKIEGVQGAILVKDNHVALGGRLPQLIKVRDDHSDRDHLPINLRLCSTTLPGIGE